MSGGAADVLAFAIEENSEVLAASAGLPAHFTFVVVRGTIACAYCLVRIRAVHGTHTMTAFTPRTVLAVHVLAQVWNSEKINIIKYGCKYMNLILIHQRETFYSTTATG